MRSRESAKVPLITIRGQSAIRLIRLVVVSYPSYPIFCFRTTVDTLSMVILYADEDDRLTFAEMLQEIDPGICLIQAVDGLHTMHFPENDDNMPDIIFLDMQP